MLRKRYLAGEIYQISTALGIPVSRAVLHLYRTKKKYLPSGELNGVHYYDRDTVIRVIEHLAKMKGKVVYREDIEERLDANDIDRVLYN